MNSETKTSLVVALVSTALLYVAVAFEVYRATKRSLENRGGVALLGAWLVPLAVVAGLLWPCIAVYMALEILSPPRRRRRR